LWGLLISSLAAFVYFLPGVVELHIAEAPEFLKAAYFVSCIAAFCAGIGLLFNRPTLGGVIGVLIGLFQIALCRC